MSNATNFQAFKAAVLAIDPTYNQFFITAGSKNYNLGRNGVSVAQALGMPFTSDGWKLQINREAADAILAGTAAKVQQAAPEAKAPTKRKTTRRIFGHYAFAPSRR